MSSSPLLASLTIQRSPLTSNGSPFIMSGGEEDKYNYEQQKKDRENGNQTS